MFPLIGMSRNGIGNDSHTTLLMHCDGADGGTTFVDSSKTGTTFGVGGTAQTDIDQKVFGTASLQLPTGVSYVITNLNVVPPGTGDYTYDFWVRFTTVDVTAQLGDNDQGYANLYIQWAQNHVALYLWFSGTNMSLPNGSWLPVINTWYHLAFMRRSGIVYTYINGVLSGSSAASGSTTAAKYSCGYHNSSQGYSLIGNMDEVRVSDIARFNVAGFTRPNRAS